MSIKHETIYDYIIGEEVNYEQPIQVIDNWDWNMKRHIVLSVLYKNSTYSTGKDDNKPFKNITRPLLNLQYRAEGFDVKDVVIYVDNPKEYYKSFLVKKRHEKWAREQGMDTTIDGVVESYVDFGGALVKNLGKGKIELVPLQSIAFADQTDLLSGPIGIKHFYSPSELKEMEDRGWGDEKNGATTTVDQLLKLVQTEDQKEKGKVKDRQEGQVSKTPGDYIEVYEVHGMLPKKYLDNSEENVLETEYVSQIQIIGFYNDPQNPTNRRGVTLFAKERKENPFKLILRDEIYGRALGLGGAEELFEPQVWANYNTIKMREMIDAASKTILQTDDPAFKTRNKLDDVDNNEILVTADGKTISQINTYPRNIDIFNKSTQEWEAHAQQMASAQDPILGETPKSGTPFRAQALASQNAASLHEYRKGKLATFIDEVYKDWVIPYLLEDMADEETFLSELSLREMQEVVELIMKNKTNNFIKKMILAGQTFTNEEVEALKEKTKEDFMRSGNKKFIKIVKEEIKKSSLSVKTNIVGKQEYLSEMVDKLGNVLRTVFTNPQILQQPPFAELFNKILESSGLNPIDFSGLKDANQQIINNQVQEVLPTATPQTPQIT